MGLEHIVVAADHSETSREAIRTALRWAARAEARVTILSVGAVRLEPALAAGPAEPVRPAALDVIEHWLDRELEACAMWPVPALADASGVPSIEIARFAERTSADMLVLGRKSRSTPSRLLLGDTADAVVRRSNVPCLLVPRSIDDPDRLLVALDGTGRGSGVLREAEAFGAALGAALRFVTVEPLSPDEPEDPTLRVRTMRTVNLARDLGNRDGALQVRHGDVVPQILAEIEESGAPVLVIGYHRGGPPGMVEGRSAARQLVHRASCAVLTIPL